MELKDRIFNIKLLLKFCGGFAPTALITDIRVGTFFAQLINNDERFAHSPHSVVYPIFKLNTFLDTNYSTRSYNIGFDYVYDINQEEYERECFFYDSDLEDAAMFRTILSGTVLQYSEIPDSIWEIIQNELYRVAMDRIRYRIITEHLSAERINSEIREFAEELQHKEEDNNS